MKINYKKRFEKQYKKAPLKIKLAFKKKVKLFLRKPFEPILHNHSLGGRLKKYCSIDITGDWRAIYSENKVIVFSALGTHSQLYK